MASDSLQPIACHEPMPTNQYIKDELSYEKYLYDAHCFRLCGYDEFLPETVFFRQNIPFLSGSVV
jgi:hypothetical protein